MSDKQFDDTVKKALDNIAPAYDASSWDLLAAKMDAHHTDEFPESVTDVDKAVFHKLERLEVPFQPAHWEGMSAMLNEKERRRTILWYKFAEVAAVLLLLLAVDGLWDLRTGNRPIQRLHALPHEIADASTAPVVEKKPGFAGVNSPEPSFSGADLNLNQTIGESGMTSATSVVLPGIAPVSVGLPEMNLAATDALPPAVPSKLTLPERTISVVPVTTRFKKPSRFYAITNGVLAQNTVKVAGKTRNSTGHGAGFGLGYKLGKWALETGIGYSSKQYEPKKEIEIYSGNVVDGYYGSALTGIEADLVHIPLKAVRQFARIGKANFSALAGVSAYVAASKSYHYKTVYFPGSAPDTHGTGTGNQDPTMRTVGRGVLEGGSLKGNAYLTADAGLRVEYPVGNNFSAFVEPSYSVQLTKTGIGKKPLGINSLALSAGLLVAL